METDEPMKDGVEIAYLSAFDHDPPAGVAAQEDATSGPAARRDRHLDGALADGGLLGD